MSKPPTVLTPEKLEEVANALRTKPNVSQAARAAGVAVFTVFSAIRRGGEASDLLMSAMLEGMEADLETIREQAEKGTRVAATEKGGTMFRRGDDGRLIPVYVRKWDPAYSKLLQEGTRKVAEMLVSIRNSGANRTIEDQASMMIGNDEDPEFEDRGTKADRRMSTA